MDAAKTVPTETTKKPVHTLILDSSPLLLNIPPLSTLISQSELLITSPSIIGEIKDQDARSRVETTYMPFLTLRRPKPESVSFVKQFAQKTGDAAVLSAVDIELIALAYDLEVEKNGGDWRLRRVPGQKHINGKPPEDQSRNGYGNESTVNSKSGEEGETALSETLSATSIADVTPAKISPEQDQSSQVPESDMAETVESDSDSEGWITPSNIKKHQAQDEGAADTSISEQPVLQVATITGDFAVQNVLLQMNLNLLSPQTCKRIRNIRTTLLRCHGCFSTTKDMTKQFCPRCGKPTLTRVTSTTNDKGQVTLHLKKNMQWNNRGNVFSIPKPTSGHSNQRWQGPRDGGGKGGWGNDLILAEDQTEHVRAVAADKRRKDRDLMDEDQLPSILRGGKDRTAESGGGRIKVGGGRNINSRKR